jgi:hypothetical protein
MLARLSISMLATAAVLALTATPAAAQHQPTCSDFWQCVDTCSGGDEELEAYCEGQCSLIFTPPMICKALSTKLHGVVYRRLTPKVTRIPAGASGGGSKPRLAA